MKTNFWITALMLSTSSGAALPHVVLEQATAAAGSSYRAVLRVGHGCDGLATTGLSVRLPAGVQSAKPMPKAGWAIAIKTEPLAVHVSSHGKRVDSDVAEISWSASAKEFALPDAHYDEFVLRATLPAAPGPLWFKVVQTCDDNGRVVRKEWTQTPTEGSSTRGLLLPAALLLVEPAAATAPAHH
jgi:periplasmic copper chaperone A